MPELKAVKSQPPGPVTQVARVAARPARSGRRRRRHTALIHTFVFFVLLPIGVASWYLEYRAADQYESRIAFSVRREDAVSPAEMLGGLAGFSGSSSRDTDILFEYIRSGDLVRILDDAFDLRRIFATNSVTDPVFAFDPDGTIEDLTRYWRRMLRVSYDPSTGLLSVSVRAFKAEDAFQLSDAILKESRLLINELSAIAREDITRQAEDELVTAEIALREARTALTEFRAKTQIVDPRADLQGQVGLISALQEQLADEMIRVDLLRTQTREGDTRIVSGEQRIAIIRARIAAERQKVGTGIDAPASGTDYARLVGIHESLSVELEIAEATYAAARTAVDAARAEAGRQSRYIAAFVKPSLPERSTGPKTAVILGVMSAFLILSWFLLTLVFYALRDRR